MIEWIAVIIALAGVIPPPVRTPFEIRKLKAEARKANAEAQQIESR